MPAGCAQVVLVSATLPGEIIEMTHKFMTEPLKVLVKRDELTLEVRCLGAQLLDTALALMSAAVPKTGAWRTRHA